jgi:hypothetical protein
MEALFITFANKCIEDSNIGLEIKYTEKEIIESSIV